MYALELKSHKEKTLGFGTKDAPIKRRQIENLVKASNAVSYTHLDVYKRQDYVFIQQKEKSGKAKYITCT